MKRSFAVAWVFGVGIVGCAAEATPEATGQVSEELSLAGSDVYSVAVGRCGSAGEGILAARVNVGAVAPACIAPAVASPRADAATRSAVPGVGTAGGTEVVRVEAGSSRVRQVFGVIAPPANPLAAPVERLRYFQATASSCDPRAIFSFTPLNDAGFLGVNVKRGWGSADVRVNPAYDLPPGWDIERLRREVLYEQAVFRGIVERPTFDILHPFAERPLLVTVFDLLPAVRSADRCPAP